MNPPTTPPAPVPNEAALRLAEADSRRDGDPAARRKALDTYRELRAHLDPARPGDPARFQWVFENDAFRDSVVAELAEAAERSADPELRETATLVRGQAAADAGRPEQAEGILRALLATCRGSGRRIERLCCLSLAKLFAHQRRGFEALVTARTAATLSRKAGHIYRGEARLGEQNQQREQLLHAGHITRRRRVPIARPLAAAALASRGRTPYLGRIVGADAGGPDLPSDFRCRFSIDDTP